MLQDLIARLEEALGKKAPRRFLPDQPGDMAITYADVTRAREILGYNPTTRIDEGIRKFARWFIDRERLRCPSS
jgi:UDP-glucuronate 4-epimerase